jgi:carbonic anhydrase/acetyltransferase-like protein (isoleucine patch superfamily)
MWTRASVGFAVLAAVVGAAPAAAPAAPPASAARSAARPPARAADLDANGSTCSPTPANRPVCSADAPLTRATFLDPTAHVRRAGAVHLGQRVYVAPFARLLAGRRAARLGVLANGEHAPEEDSGVFLSFGAQVDGAVLERDTALSVLSRVGPGVRLRSGFVVLPGKNVVTQAQADDPALGKVRPITEADRLFNEAVIHVNVGLAREYSRLAREDPSAVRGINIDPGGNDFDRTRDAPSVESALCTGPTVRRPEFRNRVIGDACFADTVADLGAAMGRRISIRADEGGPLGVGEIARMGNAVVFHALEGTDLRVGDRVRYGRRVLVHGGGRPALDPHTGQPAPTVVGNDVRLGAGAVVFRSLVRNRVTIGTRSAVVSSELAVGQSIPPRTLYANDDVFGPVEW